MRNLGLCPDSARRWCIIQVVAVLICRSNRSNNTYRKLIWTRAWFLEKVGPEGGRLVVWLRQRPRLGNISLPAPALHGRDGMGMERQGATKVSGAGACDKQGFSPVGSSETGARIAQACVEPSCADERCVG